MSPEVVERGRRRLRERCGDRRARRSRACFSRAEDAEACVSRAPSHCSSPAARTAWSTALAVEQRSGTARRAAWDLLASTSRGSPRRRSAIRTTREPPSGSPRRGLARLFHLLPGFVRLRVIRSLAVAITAAGAFAGRRRWRTRRRCCARSSCVRSSSTRPLDAICIGIPRTTPYLPRERPNPLLAAYLGLGLALRLWREAAACRRRRHRHPPPPVPPALRASHAAAVPRVLPGDACRARSRARRGGRASGRGRRRTRSTGTARAGPVIPLLPYADWAVDPRADRAARDGHRRRLPRCGGSAASRLRAGQERGAALSLALGMAAAAPRIGFLLAPPYSPIRVGASPRRFRDTPS